MENAGKRMQVSPFGPDWFSYRGAHITISLVLIYRGAHNNYSLVLIYRGAHNNYSVVLIYTGAHNNYSLAHLRCSGAVTFSESLQSNDKISLLSFWEECVCILILLCLDVCHLDIGRAEWRLCVYLKVSLWACLSVLVRVCVAFPFACLSSCQRAFWHSYLWRSLLIIVSSTYLNSLALAATSAYGHTTLNTPDLGS